MTLRSAIFLAIALVLPPCLAQDRDGDGISDEIEAVLGMDPERAEALHLVHDDKSADQGDRMHRTWKLAPDITQIRFGNVAQDRWVWRIDFAQEFLSQRARVMLYLDADNNRETGRRSGAPGTDVRLICEHGALSTAIRNADVLTRRRSLRGFVDGKTVWFSMDLVINHNENGQAQCRGYILCQLIDQGHDSDSTAWFPITAPGMKDIPKLPVGLRSQVLSRGLIAQKPWLGWRRQLQQMGAVVLKPTEAETEGMRLFNRALEPLAPGARARFASPVDGAHYLNVLVQDSAVGAEEIAISVAGAQAARLVAVQNNGDLYLFTTKKPAALSKGAPIELVAKTPAQDFRVCEVLLTPRQPQPQPLEITHLSTYVTPRALPGGSSGATVDVDVCFLTNRPVKSRLLWGEGEALANEAPRAQPTYNHRIRLKGLRRGTVCSAQAVAREGLEEARSAVTRFVADEKRIDRCAVERQRVEVTVAGAAPHGPGPWPVSGGVPVPRGALASARTCRLLDAQGAPAPAQFSELAYWSDGSLKWLLVSVVHDGAPSTYTLEYGARVVAPAVQRPVAVEETEEGVKVTTDVLQARLSRQQFAPPGELLLDSNGDGRFEADELHIARGPGLVLVDGEGKHYASAGAPTTRFEVEEAGPVRAVICAEGPFAGPDGECLKYRCRMYFYRGFAGIPIEVSLLAHAGKSGFPPTLNPIRSLTWPVSLVEKTTGDAVRWVQDDADRWVLEAGGGREEKAGHGPAAATVGGEQGRLTVAVRDFWQKYPKGLRRDGATVTAELFPELPADRYAEHTDPKLLTMNYYWFRNGAYQVASGTEPTTDVLLYFGHGPAQDDMDERNVARAWQQQDKLLATPEHYCRSGAFGELEPSKQGAFEAFDGFVRKGLDLLEAARERRREYSWMNYGDTYGERGVNWTNQEYDLQWGLLVNFARTGDAAYLDRALQAADHTVCIDMINWSDNPSVFGIQKEHALWHVGGYNTPRIEGAKYWFLNGVWNTGHVWTEGTYTAYCLTGRRRFHESIERLSEFLAASRTRFRERWVHRNYGWLTIATLGAWRTNPSPYYLNAARFFMQNVIDGQDPGTGALVHPIGECEHSPRHMGGKSFMTGVVMAGLTMMDSVEPSADLKRSLVLCADWLHARMWNAHKNGFRYAQCPQFDAYAASPNMTCWGLAHAVEVGGKPEHRDMLLRSLASMIHNRGPSTSGKGYAVQIRMTPYAVSAMDRWGMKAIPPPPPVKPEIGAPSRLYIAPGAESTLQLSVKYASSTPLAAKAELDKLPAGLQADRMAAEWQVRRGAALGPAFVITGQAKQGQEVRVRWTAGEWRGEFTAVVHLRQSLELGDAVGYVGGGDDTVGLALKTLGIKLKPLPDLSPATLAQFRALVVGREAHEKNYLGIRGANHHVLDFVHSGGTVVFVQLQDSSWQGSWLRAPLSLSNHSGALGQIVAREHPIFNTPNKLQSLTGVISYDTIPEADAAWSVLATDDKGQPAIVETRLGKGTALVVQPSPDRYVTGHEQPRPPLTTDACARFMENLMHYAATARAQE